MLLIIYFSSPKSMFYDTSRERSIDNDKCEIVVHNFGDTLTIENVHPYKYSFTKTFANIVEALANDKYFVRNFTLRGAPYDFRKAPS